MYAINDDGAAVQFMYGGQKGERVNMTGGAEGKLIKQNNIHPMHNILT
jgi:hypothetical protein